MGAGTKVSGAHRSSHASDASDEPWPRARDHAADGSPAVKTLEIVVVLGALSGVIYALMGLGLVVLYRTTNIVNFAQGDIAAAGLYVGIALLDGGWPYWVAVVVVILIGALASGALGGIFRWKWFRERDPVELVVVTVGISLVIQGIETSATGGNEYAFPSMDSHTVARIASVTISGADLVSVGAVVAIFLAIGWLYRFTSVGKAMRAIAENPGEASALGLRVGALKMASWCAAGALAAVAGLFVAPVYSLTSTSVDVLLIYGFAVVVVGGFESALGAAIVGLAVGMLQSVVGVYLSSTDVLPILVGGMLVALLIAPNGVLARRHVERV